MYRPHWSLSICQRTLGLLPCFSYCEWGCYEYQCTNISENLLSVFFLYLYPEVEFVDNMVNLVFNFGGNYHVFHSGHAILHFYQWCSRAPCVHASSVMSDSFVTPWTVAHQAPLSMGFPRQEYWSGLPCPPPGDLPNPGIEPASLASPALAGGFFTNWATREVPQGLQPNAFWTVLLTIRIQYL